MAWNQKKRDGGKSESIAGKNNHKAALF